MSKTPLTDALIERGAPSQNEYITEFIKLARRLEETQSFNEHLLELASQHRDELEKDLRDAKRHIEDLKRNYQGLIDSTVIFKKP